jgi:hypothetical protein
VKRRICLVGAALVACPLAFGVASAAAKTKTPTKPASKGTSVNCATNTSIQIATGDTGVTAPADQGTEYGTVVCHKLLGRGVEADTFTLAATGDNVAKYWMYFDTGAIHGSYDLTPQEGSFNDTNFLEVDYLGTLVVKGGTGAFAGVTGTGTMTCTTLDGIHTSCTDKLKLKLPTTTT